MGNTAAPMNLSNSGYFKFLTDEILLKILQYLEPKDLFMIAQLNKRFAQIVNHEILWTNVNIQTSNVTCLQTLRLLLNKPLANLKFSYRSIVRLKKCKQAHSPPTNNQNNLHSLKLDLYRRCNRTDLNKIFRKCGSLKVLEFVLEEPICFTVPVHSIVKYCRHIEILKLCYTAAYISCEDLRFFRDDLSKLSKLKELDMRCICNAASVSGDFLIFPQRIRKLTCTFEINTGMRMLDDFATDDGTGSDKEHSDNHCRTRTIRQRLVNDDFVAGIVLRYPNLESLHLPNCDISDRSLDAIAIGLKKLKSLSLWTASADCASDGDLSQLENMENLRFLTIPDNVQISNNLKTKLEIVQLPSERCRW